MCFQNTKESKKGSTVVICSFEELEGSTFDQDTNRVSVDQTDSVSVHQQASPWQTPQQELNQVTSTCFDQL